MPLTDAQVHGVSCGHTQYIWCAHGRARSCADLGLDAPTPEGVCDHAGRVVALFARLWRQRPSVALLERCAKGQQAARRRVHHAQLARHGALDGAVSGPLTRAGPRIEPLRVLEHLVHRQPVRPNEAHEETGRQRIRELIARATLAVIRLIGQADRLQSHRGNDFIVHGSHASGAYI